VRDVYRNLAVGIYYRLSSKLSLTGN